MRIVALGSAAIALAAPYLAVTPAHASEGECTTTTGVTVIVDASGLGSGIQQRCTDTDPATGFDALTLAGFSWSTVSRSPAMLCRIENLPDPSVEQCVLEPPGNAYWMYFRATRGGTWQYSQVGAQTTPEPGSVEGWFFYTGVTKLPTASVPAALPAAPAPVTVTPTQPTAPAAPEPTRQQSTPERGTAPPTAPEVAADGNAELAKPKSRRVGAAIRPPTPTSPAATAAISPATQADRGSALSTIIGLGTAIALAVVAFTFEYRRRRANRQL
jgi:hypothetical protein